MVPWAHRSPQTNGISIGAAVFAGLTSVTNRSTDRLTDRPTDHATRSVTTGRIYIRSTAMRPNNYTEVSFNMLWTWQTKLTGSMRLDSSSTSMTLVERNVDNTSLLDSDNESSGHLSTRLPDTRLSSINSRPATYITTTVTHLLLLSFLCLNNNVQ